MAKTMSCIVRRNVIDNARINLTLNRFEALLGSFDQSNLPMTFRQPPVTVVPQRFALAFGFK